MTWNLHNTLFNEYTVRKWEQIQIFTYTQVVGFAWWLHICFHLKPGTPTVTAHPATGDDVTLACSTTTQEVDGYLWWVNGRLDEARGTSGTLSIRSATQGESQGRLLDDETTSTYSCVAVKDGRSSDRSPEYRAESKLILIISLYHIHNYAHVHRLTEVNIF